MRRVLLLCVLTAGCGDDGGGAGPQRRMVIDPRTLSPTTIDAGRAPIAMTPPARVDLPATDPLSAAFGPVPSGDDDGAPAFVDWPRATALPFTVGASAPPLTVAALGSTPAPFGALRGLPSRASRADVEARARTAPLDARRPVTPSDVGLDSGLADVGLQATFAADELQLLAYVLRSADASTLKAAWPGSAVDPDDAGAGRRWPAAAGWEAALFEFPALGLAELRLLPVVPPARVIGRGPDGLDLPTPMIGQPIAALVPALRKLGIELSPDDTDMVESDEDVPHVDHVATFGATAFCAGESTLTAHVSPKGVVTGLTVTLCYDDDEHGDKRGDLFGHLVATWGPAAPAVDDDGDIVPAFTFRGRHMLAYDEEAWTIDIAR